MLATVRKDDIQPFGAAQESAHVVSLTPLTVRSGDVTYGARRAVGCLVDPQVGDEVLVALLPDRRAYVLSVLERDGAGVVIAVEGDCTMKASGTMSVVGAEGMEVLSGGDLDVVGGRFSVRALATSFAGESLRVVSRTLDLELERAKVAAKAVDGFFERVTQRAKQTLRITESDQVVADRIDYAANQTLRMHGAASVLTAEQVVKIDGGQVQLG